MIASTPVLCEDQFEQRSQVFALIQNNNRVNYAQVENHEVFGERNNSCNLTLNVIHGHPEVEKQRIELEKQKPNWR